MITREYGFPRLFGIHPNHRDNLAGLLVVKEVDGIPNMWPVARPGGVWNPNGYSPNNLVVHDVNRGLSNRLVRLPSPTLNMTQPNIAADPSDSRTWQRPYLFT